MNAAELQYHEMAGYLVGTFTRKMYDRRRRCTIVRTYEVINLGRAERDIKPDPDALVEAPEDWGEENTLVSETYSATVTASRERRHAAAMEKLVAYLQEHGPQRTGDLLHVTEWHNRVSLAEHCEMFPDVYLRMWDRPQVWGLHGQQYTPQPSPQSGKVRLQDALQEHGPLMVGELVKVTGLTQRAIWALLTKHEGELFERVGQKISAGGNPGALWAVKEATDG